MKPTKRRKRHPIETEPRECWQCHQPLGVGGPPLCSDECRAAFWNRIPKADLAAARNALDDPITASEAVARLDAIITPKENP